MSILWDGELTAVRRVDGTIVLDAKSTWIAWIAAALGPDGLSQKRADEIVRRCNAYEEAQRIALNAVDTIAQMDRENVDLKADLDAALAALQALVDHVAPGDWHPSVTQAHNALRKKR